jgi:hypothetical protein
MSAILERNARDSSKTEHRRLILIAVATAVAAAAWHGSQGPLIHYFATASIGLDARQCLIHAALCRAGLSVSDEPDVHSACLPRPGCVTWTRHGEWTEQDGISYYDGMSMTVFNHRLEMVGRLDHYLYSVPMDIDRDGRWEACVMSSASEDGSLDYVAVIQLDPSGNAIMWLGLHDEGPWRTRGVHVWPIWHDEDDDGIRELVFVTMTTTRTALGVYTFKPPETVASFELDPATGLLRTRELPDGCGITPWEPSAGAPVPVGPDADLDALFRELLPLPEGADEEASPASAEADDAP